MAKVKRITVSNLKAISAQTADFNGCTALIVGGNNKGKSSFLRSLPDRIRGSKPDAILKKDEKEGEAIWELTTGEKFIWKFTADKEKLTFITDKDIKTSVTKDIAARYFPAVFDVDKFLVEAPGKQKLAVEKLSGLDLAEVNAEYKSAYDERTWANKRLVEAKAKVVKVNPDLPKTESNTESLEKELSGIDLHNSKVKQVVDGISLRNKTIEDNNSTISSLEAQIAELRAKSETLQQTIADGQKWLESPKNAPIPDERKKELELQIAGVKDENKEIVENNKAILLQAAAQDAQIKADEADTEVKRIEKKKDDLIKGAKLPTGFGFSDDGITYEGFAFNREQLSSSGIYIAALKLAALTLGEVKTLHFDASFLDNKSLSDIETWANSQDLQLLIERVVPTGGEIHYELINTPENGN